ncbi:SirB2 family protein [Glaciecola sp. 2405UD65-10]|uniref:SirB2 family protein n=1 Tax=Glaciecola sp. 2405UD65-10 TaxID=3397244 RepID=UPI003B5964C7
MYMFAKHLHLTAIALSFSLFLIRFVLLMRNSPSLQKKWLKITPHIVDTVLIISIVLLCVNLSVYPFVNEWATSKLIGLVLYILSVAFALKWARNNAMRIVGLAGAIAWLAITASIAVSKNTLF